MVDILIMSINKDGMLERCLDSVINDTIDVDYQIYLCVPDEVKFFVKYPDIKFVPRSSTEPYRFSVFVNRMAQASTSEFICLLNDDVEVITPEWLKLLVDKASEPDVGVVGAKLLFPGGKLIQHVGVEMQGTEKICGLPHWYQEDYPEAPWNETKEYIAVGAAAAVVRRSVFWAVEGYDESLVAFNDVDFCLKIRELGFKNICLPASQLIHHQSYTRGEELEFLESDREIMRAKWRHLL